MSLPSATACEKCGKIKEVTNETITYTANVPAGTALTFTQQNGSDVSIPNYMLCSCPTEPAPKHDNWLDKQKDYNIDYGESWDKGIVITDFSDRYGETQYLRMPAKQALSLLAWLKQEEAELQRLAKEQEG